MRKALGTSLIAGIVWTALPAAAGENRDAVVAEILDGFLDEQRVNLTCSTLDAPNHESIVKLWDMFVKDVLSLMKDGGMPLVKQAEFAAAARPTALVMPGDTPFAVVREFCDAHPEWSLDLALLKSFPRYGELRSLLESK